MEVSQETSQKNNETSINNLEHKSADCNNKWQQHKVKILVAILVNKTYNIIELASGSFEPMRREKSEEEKIEGSRKKVRIMRDEQWMREIRLLRRKRRKKDKSKV